LRKVNLRLPKSQPLLEPSVGLKHLVLGRGSVRLRDQLPLTTTVGYRMRFLHSTGHRHKGDANNALFTRFTVDLIRDLRHPKVADSPESFITFGVLEEAERIVSMPSWEHFEQQSRDYRESIIPRDLAQGVSVEQTSTIGWRKYVGLGGP
jgi:hypothetical protein